MNSAAAAKLRKAAHLNSDEVYQMLDTSTEGITPEEAHQHLSAYGLNEADNDKAPLWYMQLLKSFANPFMFILLAIIVISFLIHVWNTQSDEKDLSVLREGVVYGRYTFGNIMKYIKMATSGNFGNVFSIIGASALLPFLPMLPIQLLVQNLLYDFSQISLPWDTVDEEYLESPPKWESKGIRRFMVYFGPISSVFDYILFAVMFFVFKANAPEHQHLFQTGWFVVGLLSQTLIIHIVRTKKIPFIQSWASTPVVASTSLVMLIGVMIPFTPLAGMLSLTPLPPSYFLWLIGILVAYSLLTQFFKGWYIKKFNEWL